MIDTEIGKLPLNNEPKGLYEPIVYSMMNGGKRIRPLLTMLACELFDKSKLPVALEVGIAFEVFHNFTLLHDDLMDNARMRRGKPTVHIKWDPSTAVLSGDAMLVEAFRMIFKAQTDKRAQIFELFAQTAREVCEGQQYDMDFEKRTNVSEAEYLEMIKLKTSVLIGACLKSGAWIGGASDSESNLLYKYGINLGLAFQLQDDWLDSFGDEKVFGKKTGGDIISGKKTFLLIKSLENPDIKKINLLEIIKDEKLNESEKIKIVKDIFIKLKADLLTREKMEEFANKAANLLGQLTEKGKPTHDLEQLGEYLLNRNK